MTRRLLNATIAGVALIVLAIPLLFVALLIKLTSAGPVLFRQQRVGKRGRPFEILKFRTMNDDSSPRSGITVGNDDRVTAIGSFLRRTKIDELPQLINILRGDMNLVGPRPELPEFVRKYSDADRELVLSIEPGITDFASIRYRNEGELLAASANALEYYERVLVPKKLRYARFYVRRASVGLDCYIIAQTMRALIGDALGGPAARRTPQQKTAAKDTPPCVLRAQ